MRTEATMPEGGSPGVVSINANENNPADPLADQFAASLWTEFYTTHPDVTYGLVATGDKTTMVDYGGDRITLGAVRKQIEARATQTAELIREVETLHPKVSLEVGESRDPQQNRLVGKTALGGSQALGEAFETAA